MLRRILISAAILLLYFKTGNATGSEGHDAFEAGLKSFPVQLAFSEADSVFVIHKPNPFDWAKGIPGNTWTFCKTAFHKKNLRITGALIGASAALMIYDQEMLDGVQKFSTNLGLDIREKPVAIIDWTVKIGKSTLPLPVFVPGNLNTGFYFLGDGLPHFLTAATFWSVGKINKDNRALQTSSQLLESMLTSGLIIQVLKHTTGRQSPSHSTQKGGRWRPFPNQSEYAKHVPAYDAFPSGHIATFVSTFVVISDNYPENKWVKPMGYSLGTVLMYAMVNNGVHWISDYPLGIAIGYTCAKIVTQKRMHEMKVPAGSPSGFIHNLKPGMVLPVFGNNTTGVRAFWSF